MIRINTKNCIYVHRWILTMLVVTTNFISFNNVFLNQEFKKNLSYILISKINVSIFNTFQVPNSSIAGASLDDLEGKSFSEGPKWQKEKPITEQKEFIEK